MSEPQHYLHTYHEQKMSNFHNKNGPTSTIEYVESNIFNTFEEIHSANEK